jgi:hypothetical protein
MVLGLERVLVKEEKLERRMDQNLVEMLVLLSVQLKGCWLERVKVPWLWVRKKGEHLGLQWEAQTGKELDHKLVSLLATLKGMVLALKLGLLLVKEKELLWVWLKGMGSGREWVFQ